MTSVEANLGVEPSPNYSRVERIGDATLYLGDCRDILPTLGKFDAVVTDPPYGTAELWGPDRPGRQDYWRVAHASAVLREWDVACPEIVETLPNLARQAIIWGGHFYRLPVSRSWLVWNKIIRNFSTGVCELAWTSLCSPIDAFDYSHGQLANEGKTHPTQKPVPLMSWCVAKTAGAVLDPFMGSGTTGVACANLGRKFIGIEIDPGYFDIACRRIEDAYRQPRLFAEPEPKMLQSTMFDQGFGDGTTNNNPPTQGT